MDKKSEAGDLERATKDEEDKKTKLIFSRHGGQTFIGAQLPYRDGLVQRQIEVHDKLLALAELPAPEELQKILLVSANKKIPSIWRRARASALESDAAALLTALAFATQKQQVVLLNEFFRFHRLNAGTRGRPRTHPKMTATVTRGIQIDEVMTRLQKGFELKMALSDAEKLQENKHLADRLSNLGYEPEEVRAMLIGSTLQDAALSWYHATAGGRENLTMKSIRNSFSRYKSLRRQA